MITLSIIEEVKGRVDKAEMTNRQKDLEVSKLRGLLRKAKTKMVKMSEQLEFERTRKDHAATIQHRDLLASINGHITSVTLAMGAEQINRDVPDAIQGCFEKYIFRDV